MAPHETAVRAATANKANNIAFFDAIEVRKFFVEIDAISYPKNLAAIEHAEKYYLDQEFSSIFFRKLCWRTTIQSNKKLF